MPFPKDMRILITAPVVIAGVAVITATVLPAFRHHHSTPVYISKAISLATQELQRRGRHVDEYEPTSIDHTNYCVIRFCEKNPRPEDMLTVDYPLCPWWVYVATNGQILAILGKVEMTTNDLLVWEDNLRAIYRSEGRYLKP